MASLTGSTTAVFFVRLSTAVDEIVDVDWNTRDGTAIAGQDYEAASGTVSFLPGETEKAIDVVVYGQGDVSADGKKFYIELKPPANAVLTDALAECVITVADEDGVLVTSLVIAQGKRGLKGNPGLSAYEQAVLMGYTGTVEQWMDEIGDASQAADRAEGYAADSAASAATAEQKSNEAIAAVGSTQLYVDAALSNLSTAANKFYPTLADANADIANIQVDQPVTIGESANGGLWYKATAVATSLTKSPYDPFAQGKNYSDNLKSLSDAEDVNVNGRISRLLVAIEQIVTSIIDVSNDVDSLNASQSLALSNAVNDLKVELTTNITNAVSVPNTENFNINVRLSRLLVSIQQIAQVISDLKSETDGEFLAVNSLIASNNTSNNNSISSLSIEASDINKRISYLLMGLQQLTAAISTNSDDIDALASSTTANTLVNSKASLGMNMALQTLTMELHKLDDFNPEFAGANTTVVSENVTFFPIPSSVIRIDVETSSSLPTAKGTVILANIAINVDGQVLQSKGTVEVQGSSSAGFPKKNWTFGFFSDDARENAIKVKLGHMMPHEELVWKANLVDNTQSRNITVNRLYDQFQMSRSGFPKREPDFVNMVGGVGLAYAPTGAIGHVDGFPSVVYINGVFYGLGTLNIGKKRENYNLDKNKATHIQLEPQGNVNYVAMPSSPTNTDSGLEIRRPSTWGLEAQGYYERLVAWMAKSRADMEADGIDNYFNRANLMDYIILVQVCDLWDHMGKNAELTTWDGQVWNFLPYDCDTVFGLWWTGTIMDLATSTAWRPAANLLITQNTSEGPVGFFSKCRRIYGADIDARYAELRNRGIISVDNITNICLEIIRKFPSELLKAEDAKWKTDSNSNYGGLVQSSSMHQINNWLSVHIPVVDAYFNYTA